MNSTYKTNDTENQNNDTIEMCLCGRCLHNFLQVPGHRAKRADYSQTVLDVCFYCNSKFGYDYILESLQSGKGRR